MQAHEAADVVGRLDVDVERNGDGGADRGDLRERQVRGQIDGGCAEALEDARRRRVRRREHHRHLRLHLLRQQARALRLVEELEHPEVGDQHRAEPVLRRAHAVLEVRDDLLLAVSGRRKGGVDARGRREAPTRVRAREERTKEALCTRYAHGRRFSHSR